MNSTRYDFKRNDYRIGNLQGRCKKPKSGNGEKVVLVTHKNGHKFEECVTIIQEEI